MDSNDVKDLATLAAQDARKPWGAGWAMLSEKQRETETMAACMRLVMRWPTASECSVPDLHAIARTAVQANRQ